MKRNRISSLRIGVLLIGLILLLILAMACASTEPTQVPVAPQQPAQPAAPVGVPQPTVVLIPGAPTPIPAKATPTRVLPTATPVPASQIKYGGILRYPGVSRSFDNFDPAFSVQTGPREMMHGIFNPLVELAPDSTVLPELAESWDISNGGKTITFSLVKNAKFHDGTKLDANAVKWNFDRYLDPDVGSPRALNLVPPLEKVEVVDDYTIRFTLDQPSRAFMSLLIQREAMIASPTAVQNMNSYADHTGDFGANPVGSGPYKFVRWLIGREVMLEKNPDYWEEGLPYLDGVRFNITEDFSIQFAMLRTGEIDMMNEMRTEDAVRARSIEGINVVQRAGVRIRWALFKTNVPPWDNLALREAFAYATDRQVVLDVVYSGFGLPAYTAIASGYGKFWDSESRMFAYDPEKAKQKLVEAGYPNGFEYTQRHRTRSFEIPWAETLQSMWADVGIKANLQPYVNRTYYTDWVGGEFDSPMIAGLSARSDAHIDLTLRFRCSNRYVMAFCNPEVDRLLDQAAATYDQTQAAALYHQISRLVIKDLPGVPIVDEAVMWGLQDYVHGFNTYLDKQTRVKYIWMDK